MLVSRLVSFARLSTVIYRTLRHKPTSARTVADLVEERAAHHPERPFVLFEDRRVSYGELNAMANRVARWAHGLGLRRGDRVALMMPNRPEFLMAWAGLAKLGVVVPLLNTNLRGQTLAYALRVAGARHLVAGTECLDQLAGVAREGVLPEVFAWGPADAGAPLPARPLAPLLAEMPVANPERGWRRGLVAGDDLFLIYTSGTTGYPKPARMSHMRFIAIGDAMSAVARYGRHDVVYCPLPLYHGAGGVVVPASALTVGCTMALREKFSASRFWDDCRRFGASGFQYVGEVCHCLLNQPPRSDDRDHGVRVMMGTGLRSDLWERFRTRFGVPRVIESYGSTEGNASLMNLDGRPGSVGRIPFKFAHNARLIRYDAATDGHPRDADGRCLECRPGEVGELVGRISGGDSGARRFEGYLSEEDTEQKILRDVFRPGDAWFRTGDLLREDAEGYFYFVDRIGDTFRWKSENVSTQEVAAILGGAPGVEIASVYGVEVPGEAGRAGMAAIVLRPGAVFDGAALFDFTLKHLPRYAAPLFVRVRPEADFTGTIKLRKVELRDEGYDLDRVTDPLYVRDEGARAYVALTRERAGGPRPGRVGPAASATALGDR